MVVIATALPALPEHVRVYVESCASGPTLCEPEIALVPVQAPDALQLVTFVLVHVNVDEPLRATPGGFAEMLRVAEPAVTVTVAVFATVVPLPAQVRLKLPFPVNAPVLCEPDVPFEPVHEPDAAQLVALVVLHVNCDAEPD